MQIIWFILSLNSPASAQWQSSNWLHLDGAYVQREVREEDGPTLTSTRAGARGELGLSLGRHFALSGGGSYHDGVGSVTGAGRANHASGYASDTRALVHLIYAPFVLAGGLAQYEGYDNVPDLYRARTAVSYQPVMLSVNWGLLYARFEQSLKASGSISRTYADQGGGRVNLKFTLPKAREQTLEIGGLLPSVKWTTRVFASFTRWQLDAPDRQSDGVESVGPGPTQVTTLMAGLGLAF